MSRFPILNSWTVNANLVVHLQTESVWGFDAVILNAHTPAHVENQEARLNETRNFMLLLRSLLNGSRSDAPSSEFTLILTGDLNANSPKLELSSPRTGTFSDPAFQSLNYWTDDFHLPLVDAAPRHTHTDLPRIYTWRSLESGNTQRLDYIYYQQSRLTMKKAFVVDTQSMPVEFLERHGILAADARESDHLMLVTDFAPRQVDYAWLAEDTDVPDWVHSQWFGWLYQVDDSLFYSPLHGYAFAQFTANGAWLWDPVLGWWFSSSAIYPYAYRAATGSWLYFRLSPVQPRAYFDFSTGQWSP